MGGEAVPNYGAYCLQDNGILGLWKSGRVSRETLKATLINSALTDD